MKSGGIRRNPKESKGIRRNPKESDSSWHALSLGSREGDDDQIEGEARGALHVVVVAEMEGALPAVVPKRELAAVEGIVPADDERVRRGDGR